MLNYARKSMETDEQVSNTHRNVNCCSLGNLFPNGRGEFLHALLYYTCIVLSMCFVH